MKLKKMHDVADIVVTPYWTFRKMLPPFIKDIRVVSP